MRKGPWFDVALDLDRQAGMRRQKITSSIRHIGLKTNGVLTALHSQESATAFATIHWRDVS
jgi:hypothetical protein